MEKQRKKRRRIPIAVRNRILVYVNAILSAITAVLGVLTLLFAEMETGIFVAFLAVDGACVVAIVQEISALVLRRTKRAIITSSVCIFFYIVLFFFPTFVPDDTLLTVQIVAVIGICIYISVRFGKVIANTIIDKQKGYILQSVLFGLILVGSVVFLGINYAKTIDVCYYLGVFLIGEGLIFICMTFITGMAAKRFIKILVRTHAASIVVGMFLLLILCSTVLYFVEVGSEPGTIQTFGDAMWYCFATITTIGFGDYTAKTFAGRIITVLLGIYGIGVVALITSIIVNLYNDSVEANKERTAELEKKIDKLAEKNERLLNGESENEGRPEEAKPAESKPEEAEASPHQDGEGETTGD